MAETKKLFLLDAYALIYRSYYAFIRNPRYNSNRLNTSAAFGFTATLDDVLRNQQPTHVAVVFDPPTPTFRHEMYEPYKANRPPTPEDLKSNIPYIKRIIEGYNIPVISVDGYEADDVIGTLAKKAEALDYNVFMMTPDKDFCQLVSDKVKLYKPARSGNKAEVWGPKEVKEKYRIKKPEQMIDILAMWGDSSDNVPGIAGVGEKTASRLIEKYGSLEGLYKNTQHLKGKQQENVIKAKEQVFLSKKLVTIVTDVPVEFDEERFKRQPVDKEALGQVFDELEFRTIKERVLSQSENTKTQHTNKNLFGEAETPDVEKIAPDTKFATIEDTTHNYHLIDSKELRNDLLALLETVDGFCFDTETTDINAHNAQLVGIAFAVKAHEAYYVPCPENQAETQLIVDEFKPLFANEKIEKTGQNLKYDIQVLQNYDVEIKGRLFDTMLAHYLLQPDLRHNLSFLSEQYLNYKPVEIEALIGKKGKNQTSMRNVPLRQVKEYAGEDADLTLQIKVILEKELHKYNLINLFETIEMPLVSVLADMENTGVCVNKNALDAYAKQLKTEIAATEKQIFEQAGTEFNVASPKQLGEVLFEKLKITDKPKMTKTKQYSTSEQELQKLRDKHPIVDNILKYRSLTKLLSTYVEALPKLINSRTGRIHTSFNQAVAATGRLSSNNPNLQNIPVRTEEGREIRKSFVPSSDEHLLLAADYSQIELRLMAHLSKDENMLEAFRNKKDIHAATAAKIFNVALEKVDRTQRNKAKSANFGIIYGISAFGLAQNTGISRSEAKELIDNYFNTYPKVKEYMDKQVKTAREQGYVETIKGRRRYLPDINSRNYNVRGIAERNAINAPIQGSAADIIKIAMLRVFRAFTDKDLKAKMLLQVHDELIFDVPKAEMETVKTIVKTEMESAVELSIPLTVDLGTGSNWLEAH